MKCKYCGADLEENSKFCIECGKPVEEETIELPETKEEKEINKENSLNELPETKTDIIPNTSEEVIDNSIEEAKEVTKAKTNKKFNCILIVLIVLFLAIGIVALYMLADFKKSDKDNSNTTTTTTTQAISDNYDCTISGNEVICSKFPPSGETIETTVNEVPIKIVFEEYNFKIYVNNNFVIEDSDTMSSNKITFKSIGNYIVYTTIGGTDIRSDSMIFVGKDGNIIKDLYDPEVMDSGMYADPETIVIENNKIIVPATRISHGPSIITEKNDVEGKYICSSELDLPDDYVVNATYTFTIDADGAIDFNNYEKQVTKTLSEFKLETADYCANSQVEE